MSLLRWCCSADAVSWIAGYDSHVGDICIVLSCWDEGAPDFDDGPAWWLRTMVSPVLSRSVRSAGVGRSVQLQVCWQRYLGNLC